tara:strand:+ start:277 stop:480 length:204 start_codon:yes stop_codon:yes gene_type:complete
MSLFSKIFSAFKKREPKLTESQMKELMDEVIDKNKNILEKLDDKTPPIIGDDYPTYEQIVNEYKNSK